MNKAELKYFCKKCNKQIWWQTGLYGSGLCGSCCKIGKSIPRPDTAKRNRERKFNGFQMSQKAKENISRFHAGVSGNKNPNWKGGKSFEPYPLGWTKTFKEQIRYRDKYKCQICSCPEVECNRKLDVHHIGYDKENINPENLISLCNSCHIKTNVNRKYWTKYFKGIK